MPKTFVPQSLIQSVVLALLFATLSACGGGGSEIPGAGIDTGGLVILAIRPASILSLISAFIHTRLLGRPPKDNRTVVEILSPWCRITTRYTRSRSFLAAERFRPTKSPTRPRCRRCSR